ncbi:MLP1_3 [Sanghuangporus vaninii]
MNCINLGEFPVPSVVQISPNVSADSLFNFSPNISRINRIQTSSETFIEVYAEYVRMQGELAKKQHDMENLDRMLGGVLAGFEDVYFQLTSITHINFNLDTRPGASEARNRATSNRVGSAGDSDLLSTCRT